MAQEVNTQVEWEKNYQSLTYRNKNEYPSEEIISFVLRKFGSLSNRSEIKILELGCGWGNNLKFLKEKGFDFAGIDFSETAVKHCQAAFGNTVQGDISNLPFRSSSFDCVLDRMAIQHNSLDKIVAIFKEAHRHIRFVKYSEGIAGSFKRIDCKSSKNCS